MIADPLEPPRDRLLFSPPKHPSLEGGDVLVLSEDVLAVGHSERTNWPGILSLARSLGRREDGPRWVLVVEFPHRRSYMHLDTLMTPVDRDACLVYPPVILPGGREQAKVWELDTRSRRMEPRACGDLLTALKSRGLDYEPIPCGGDDLLDQQREQWTDGANALAFAPGVIALYDRNARTAETLSRKGFRCVNAVDVLLGREEIDLDEPNRVCILLSSNELCRARGGPHCLVHPLVRDEATA